MLGQHLIKSWSTTQVPISLSSGEAEFYGVVKASSVALGYQAMMEDLGLKMAVRVWTDSTATMGICGRRGLGKLRHIDTQCLWIQQKVRRKEIELRKVLGEMNPADLFTKHLPSREKIHQLIGLFGCEYREGRAASAPLLRPLGSDGQQGGHLAGDDPLPTFAAVTEDIPHDESRLPHMYSTDDIARLFPIIEAAPEQPNTIDYDARRDNNDDLYGDVRLRRGCGMLRGERRASADTPKQLVRAGK